MKKCKICIKDEVFCVISGLSKSDSNYVYEKMSMYVDGYRYMPRFKLGQWDGKINFYKRTGNTYLRLLDQIVPYIVKFGYDIELIDKRVYTEQIESRLESDRFKDFIGYNNESVFIRPYQCNAINTLLDNGSGIYVAATSAGKTLMCAGLSDILFKEQKLRSIIIVPSSDLVKQTYEAYKMVGLNVSKYSGESKDLSGDHVIATWQSLQHHPYIMRDFQAVIVDECHTTRANIISELISIYGHHIAYRFGITGTMPKSEMDIMNIKCVLGSVVGEVTAKQLQDLGYIAKVEIDIIQTIENTSLPDYFAEKKFLAQKEDRLELIADLIIENRNKHGNTLVLVSDIKFGKRLNKLIPEATFMYGATDGKTRKENYDEFEENDGVIKICTIGIASVGISINRIFGMILIDMPKSFIKSIQSIGRGLRLAKDKKSVNITDISATLKYSKKHLGERKKWYKMVEYPIFSVRRIKY